MAKQRYFFVSDIHGQYDKLVLALANSGFDMDKDTIVSVGDPFDRGPDSKKVLEFLMSCPNRILILGNHDMRLKQVLARPTLFDWYDISNGMPETFKSFLGMDTTADMNYWECADELSNNALLWQYFRETVYYVEFKDLIAVHAWIPYKKMQGQLKPFFSALTGSDWREAMPFDWSDAVWANTEQCIKSELFPEKKLLIGHWHAWRLAQLYGEKREDENKSHTIDGITYGYMDCSTFETDKFIAIDGCSNYPNGGVVNVYVYETDESPKMRFTLPNLR